MIAEKTSRYAVVQVDHPDTVMAGSAAKIVVTIITKAEMAISGNIVVDLKLNSQSQILKIQSTAPPTKDHPLELIVQTPEMHMPVDVLVTVQMHSLHGTFEEEVRSQILVVNSSGETILKKVVPSSLRGYDWFGLIIRNPSIIFLALFSIFITRSIFFYYENAFSFSESAATYGFYSLVVGVMLLLIKQFRFRAQST